MLAIIRSKLRSWPNETEDHFQEARLQLWQCVQSAENRSSETVRNLAAAIAWRVCIHRLRRDYPQFQALRNRVRYALARQRGLAQWRANDTAVAGFAAWQGARAPLPAGRLAALLDDRKFEWQTQGWASQSSASFGPALIEWLTAIFNHAAAPVPLNELVAWLADKLALAEPQQTDDAALAEHQGTATDPAQCAEQRAFLTRLWEEIVTLPLHQRAAVLLNLRDEAGRGCIAFFPLVGIASLAQLAATLELTPERFAELWHDLPLEDARIAELFGLTRQQVINARKSARERLARRLRGFA